MEAAMVRINNSKHASLRRTPSKQGSTVIVTIVLGLFTLVGILLAVNIRTTTNIRVPSTNGIPTSVAAQVIVGYAISVTGCGSDPITEGAAVLKHSIHESSSQAGVSKYDYQMYAIVHPDGQECAAQLKDLGYKVLVRETPVAVNDIEGEFLRTHIEKNGCCGEKELIKLEAYTFTDHPIVVHMDLDTLVLKPMDSIFDLMLGKSSDATSTTVDRMWKEETIPETINAFFTRDYNMVPPRTKYKPVQGGFLVLRPDMAVYQEFVEIIKTGDFREHSGWGGQVGPFYGSMTFQGIIPYFYDFLHPGTAMELNRCVYNQMCDNPRDKKTVNNIVQGNCRTGEETCEDCRERKLEDVVTSHFTLCQKPWWCLPQDDDRIQEWLCKKLHHEWYRVRSNLEKSWGRSGMGSGTFKVDHFFGYCNGAGKGQYVPMEQPFGRI